MKEDYFDNFEPEIIFYILGYMVFICTFIICIKMISVNILISLIICSILTFTSTIYLFNIHKYSVFEYDIIIFLGIFFAFSFAFYYVIFEFIYLLEYDHLTVLIVLAALTIINYIVSILKLSKMSFLENYRVAFIVAYFCYVCIAILCIYSYIFISYNNTELINFINNNCKFNNVTEKFKIKDIDYVYQDYISREPVNKYSSIITKVNKEMSINEVYEYVKLRYGPILRVDDFLLFSGENLFLGKVSKIEVNGTTIKLLLISQRLVFAIIVIITIVGLIDLYKPKENYLSRMFKL